MKALRIILRMLFCHHDWSQRAWLGRSKGAFVCLKCGTIRYAHYSKIPMQPRPEITEGA